MRTSWHRAERSRRGAALAVALVAGLAGPLAEGALASGKGDRAFDAAVLRELNRVRTHHSLPRVRLDRRMGDHAAAYSREMARSGVLTHGAWSGRVARAAGQRDGIGEVIGWLTATSPHAEARLVVQWWLDSPTHRAVVLRRTFRRVGVGRATGDLSGARTAIYTVDFATPR